MTAFAIFCRAALSAVSLVHPFMFNPFSCQIVFVIYGALYYFTFPKIEKTVAVFMSYQY